MVKIEIKEIKPRKADLPLRKWQRMQRRLAQTFEGPIDRLVTKAFEKRVRNWQTKVSFKSKLTAGPRRIRLDTGPYGRNKCIWVWVSGGTYPRPIRPVRARWLTVQDYYPKTTVGGGYGFPGARAGPISYRTFVHNKGIKARNFELYIAKEVEDRVVWLIRQAITRVFEIS